MRTCTPWPIAVALRSYPRQFRARFGADLARALTEAWRAAGRGGALTREDEAAKSAFEAAVLEAGLEAPTHVEVAEKTGLVEVKAKKYCDLLVREGRILRLGDLVFHSESLEQLKRLVRDRREVDPTLDIAAFRELSGGLSRKYSIPLLEWLDRERVTRRVGDRREIL